MRVFNLGKPNGEWETKAIGNDRRTFGFCSVQWPSVGDLVVIDRTTTRVLYQIESLAHNPPARYEDVPEYKFFSGVMRDVVASDSWTQEMVDLLKEKGVS